MKSAVLAISFLAILSASPAAGSETETLLEDCKVYLREGASTSPASPTRCFGYISGFYDGWTTGQLYIDKKTRSVTRLDICFPLYTAPSFRQLIAIFVRWGENNPAQWHVERWQAVREAFAEAFPCED